MTHTNNSTDLPKSKCCDATAWIGLSAPVSYTCDKCGLECDISEGAPTEQQATPTSDEELRKKMQSTLKYLAEDIADEFGGDLYEHPQDDLVDGYTAEAVQLLHQYGNTRELEGKIDELNSLMTRLPRDEFGDQQYILNLKARDGILDRIAELTKAKEQE